MARPRKITPELTQAIIHAWLERQRLRRLAAGIPSDADLATRGNVHVQAVRRVIEKYVESVEDITVSRETDL